MSSTPTRGTNHARRAPGPVTSRTDERPRDYVTKTKRPAYPIATTVTSRTDKRPRDYVTKTKRLAHPIATTDEEVGWPDVRRDGRRRRTPPTAAERTASSVTIRTPNTS